MSWRIIFTGAVCFLLALAVGAAGFLMRREFPWVSGLTCVVDAAIIVGGLKTVLDTTKTANELRKMGFEMEKLQLEIHHMQKQEAHVHVATFEEVEKYGVKPIPAPRQRSAVGLTTAFIALLICGTVYFAIVNSELRQRQRELAKARQEAKAAKEALVRETQEAQAAREALVRERQNLVQVRAKEEARIKQLLAHERRGITGTSADLDPVRTPKTAEQIKLEEELLVMESRAAAVRGALDMLARRQSALGLALRPDLLASRTRMDEYLKQARDQSARGNLAEASKSLEAARHEVDSLQGRLGN